MKRFFGTIWKAEPVLVSIITSVAFWQAIPPFLAAIGHPVPDGLVHAGGAIATVIGAAVARGQVSPT